MLSEKEKEAIKELEHYINITPYWKIREYTNSEIDNHIKIVLNLVKKQQNLMERLKKDKDILYGVIDELKEENNEESDPL